MFTASQKKRDNIAEYLLYMWQIEDIIRANNLDINEIEKNIIDKYKSLSDQEKTAMRDWYESLIDMMRRENVAKKGHLQLNKNIIIQLQDLQHYLMADKKYSDFSTEYYKTLPYIVELRAKSGENKADEIETCFNALYGVLMLRLSGKEIGPDTALAIKQITKYLALLSHYYKLDYNDQLQLSE